MIWCLFMTWYAFGYFLAWVLCMRLDACWLGVTFEIFPGLMWKLFWFLSRIWVTEVSALMHSGLYHIYFRTACHDRFLWYGQAFWTIITSLLQHACHKVNLKHTCFKLSSFTHSSNLICAVQAYATIAVYIWYLKQEPVLFCASLSKHEIGIVIK